MGNTRNIASLIATFALAAPVCGGAEETGTTGMKRILFIGNSYTGQIRKALEQVLGTPPDGRAEMAFIVPGGCTLKRHLGNAKTLETIEAGKWDFVVLQDQSQTPALPGPRRQSFHDAAGALCEAIRKAGATPVFYMTWGRRDGDRHNPKLFPDYEIMQEALSSAYRTAAEQNEALLAPVGAAWKIVRHKHPELGKSLYKKDGSHPSAKGAYLAACVFARVLFDDPLEAVEYKGTITAEERQTIIKAVLEAMP